MGSTSTDQVKSIVIGVWKKVYFLIFSFWFLFKDINLGSITVDHQGDSFRVETIIKDYSYLIHIGKYLNLY